MPSPDRLATATLHERERRALAALARDSLACGVRTGRALAVDVDDLSPALARPGACFVTLRLDGELRGCIGSIEPREPLGIDVAENAFKAGFRDPRFAPIDASELARIEIEVSVLSPLEPLGHIDASELAARLVPGRDGALIRQHGRSGTFLPAVWKQLPDPAAFVAQLLRKAGFGSTLHPTSFDAWRYTVETVGGAEESRRSATSTSDGIPKSDRRSR